MGQKYMKMTKNFKKPNTTYLIACMPALELVIPIVTSKTSCCQKPIEPFFNDFSPVHLQFLTMYTTTEMTSKQINDTLDQLYVTCLQDIKCWMDFFRIK